jgi:hypothetical protein
MRKRNKIRLPRDKNISEFVSCSLLGVPKCFLSIFMFVWNSVLPYFFYCWVVLFYASLPPTSSLPLKRPYISFLFFRKVCLVQYIFSLISVHIKTTLLSYVHDINEIFQFVKFAQRQKDKVWKFDSETLQTTQQRKYRTFISTIL